MTPAQHTSKAEALLAAYETPPGRLVYTDHDWLKIQAHAELGRTAGTGSHYTAADTLLAEVTDPGVTTGRAHQTSHLTRALIHARLAA